MLGTYLIMKAMIGSWDSVEVEVPTRLGRVQVASGSWEAPIDICSRFTSHHLQISMLPESHTSSARSCFRNHWNPQRFEACGSAFFIPAGNEIHFKSEVKHLQSVVCEFNPGTVEAMLEQQLDWESCALRAMLDIRNRAIRDLCRRIVQEIRNPSLAAGFMIDALATQVAVEISRHIHKCSDGPSPCKLSEWRLRLIDQRLSEEKSAPTLEELAELCSLSVRHLCRAFQETRQQSLGLYVAQRRAEHAKRMIASGMAIKSVAYSLGFSAPSNFTRAFRRATGESPKQYLERIRAEKMTLSLG